MARLSLRVIVALVIGLLLGYFATNLIGGGYQTLPTGFVTALALPDKTIKLSECIPAMGEHHAVPTDLLFGPIYLVENGKVIGIEYMIGEEELESEITEIAGTKIGKSFTMSTLGVKIDHIEVNYLPEGHEGAEEPHYDVHMYLISKQEQQNLC